MSATTARLLGACALAFALGCDAPTASRPEFAFDPTQLSGGKIYRWPLGKRISVWVDYGDTTSTTVRLSNAAANAVGAWTDQTSFEEYALVLTSDLTSADVVIYDRSRPMPVRPGACAFDQQGAIGYTYICPSPTDPSVAQKLALADGTPSQVSVVIAVDRGRVTSQGGYAAAVTHELGHALGIGGHSTDTRDVMYPVPTTFLPTTRDVSTLLFVLGRKPDLRL